MSRNVSARLKRHLACSLSAGALLASAPLAVQAQDSQEDDSPRGSASLFIEEITISATKKSRDENVQAVPIAVTAYGEAQLDALRVRTLQSLSFSQPNIQFEDIGTVKGFANFSIRGLGVNSSIPSIDPSVGTFVDGMYIGTNGGVVFDTFDMESLEILRGPQGVLFGRNVTGGAVVLNTTKPTEELTAKVKVAADSGLRGTGGNYYAMGRVSGAIVPDKVRLKVAAYYNNDEGWHENLADGENIGGSETVLLRSAITFLPTDTMDLTIKYEYGQVKGDGPAAQNRSIFDRNTFDLAIDEVGFVDSEWNQIIAELNWDVPLGEDGRITNIFAWREFDLESVSDIDARPDGSIIVGVGPDGPIIAPLPFLFHSSSQTFQNQISNELRYSGRFGDMVDLTTGFYYFSQELTYVEGRFVPPSGDFSGGGIQDHETVGIFASADIDITETTTLTVGGRYTHENKQAQVVTLPANLQPSGFAVQFPIAPGLCNVAVDINQCNAVLPGDASWDFFTPRIAVQHRLLDDRAQVYASWTRGFRAGGFNLRRTLAARPFREFDPERIDSYEAGFKYQNEDRTVRFNSAFFFMDVRDMQRDINLADPLVGVGQDTSNTADAEIYGIELEAQWAVTEQFLLTGHFGWQEGDYTNIREDISFDPNRDVPLTLGTINAADFALDIPRLAPFSWGIGAIYDQPIGEHIVTFRGNWNYRDQFAYTDNNAGFINQADMVDASIDWRLPGDQVTISLYGRNLLNEVTAGGDTQLPLVFQDPTQRNGNVPTFSPLNRGRVFGIELNYQM